MAPPGIKPATFQFVAQCLNPVPLHAPQQNGQQPGKYSEYVRNITSANL
jgi:hypothetical protein